jgi:septal ring factor EnvC (AmiA/AmiB activator)
MHEPPPGSPRGEPPSRLDEDARPATVADVRALRRWLLVAGAWAVAATAIAVIALLAANRDDGADEDRRSARTASQVSRLETDLNDRIDELEQRIDELPASEDLSDLDNRLKRVEDGAGDVSGRVDELGTQLEELEQRVEAVEQARPETTETEPAP